jgi:hypothetical protein|tara:strand:+ start:166 stop:321 length:156 start_codon:yes stop_codon:yes gene_type:complete
MIVSVLERAVLLVPLALLIWRGRRAPDFAGVMEDNLKMTRTMYDPTTPRSY